MLDTLFGLIPSSSKGEQWIAEELQLINWGGYDGSHRIRFAPGATLLCGGSGSGKSTLMDAYIALVMPHTTPFNGASNGGVTGRPRGDEQRNILSYGRGKLDETRTDSGTRVQVLRGDDRDTWTAVSMTWKSHDGQRFTAVRAWYIPVGARLVDDLLKLRATIHDTFDLSSLEVAAQQRLSEKAARNLGLDTVGTDREFLARIHLTLGIGAAGSGTKAMNLLARIQAGQQITTVDELYKRMVLEEPDTLTTADAVVEHFDELEGTRQKMLEAQKQVRTLRPIREIGAKIAKANDELEVIKTVGSFADTGSLATLWGAQNRLGLLRQVEAELGQRNRVAAEKVRACREAAEAADAEHIGLVEVLRNSGGDRLEAAQRELDSAVKQLAEVTSRRAKFTKVIECLSIEVASGEGFGELLDRATAVLADDDANQRLLLEFSRMQNQYEDLCEQKGKLEEEYSAAQRHSDNVPEQMHRSREILAEATGISIDSLPFVAELIDIKTEYEPWREAFNLALGGFATTLLIDVASLGQFRKAINSVQTPVRLRYEGVHTGLQSGNNLDPTSLPGRLDYRDTPFTGWLQERLEDRFGFICVDRPEDLNDHRHALTITGQVAQGSRGAHGGQGRPNVLGFSNQYRLRQLSQSLQRIAPQIEMAEKKVLAAQYELRTAEDKRVAYSKVVDFSWESIDVAQAENLRARWAKTIDDITSKNPKIAQLQKRIDDCKRLAVRLQQDVGRAEKTCEDIRNEWAVISDDVDEAQDAVDQALDEGRELEATQGAYLDSLFVFDNDSNKSRSAKEILADFNAAFSLAKKNLNERRESAQNYVDEQRSALQRVMESYQENWYNPNLLTDPETSASDFEKILVELETSGLFQLEAEWKESLLNLSGNDLTNLDSTLSRSLREIRERIEPINSIMQNLPFYDDDHRLQISARENQSERRRKFRRELREVRQLIEDTHTDGDREKAYQRMAGLIDRIRRNSAEFADLVDVRNHVRVSAEKIHATTGKHVALYDHIGEKSGGESQELIAFIVGAALRYQLGDAASPRPRYAPVFLDEALIKADAHFTKRAIGAWRGLGFQLIIGAPIDKYSAIEPHIEAEYDILKDTRGRSWARPKVGVSEEAL